MDLEKAGRLFFLIAGISLSYATYYFFDLYDRDQGDTYRIYGTVENFKISTTGRGTIAKIKIYYHDNKGNKITGYLFEKKSITPYSPGDNITIIAGRSGSAGIQLYNFTDYWGGIVLTGIIAFCFLSVSLFYRWI